MAGFLTSRRRMLTLRGRPVILRRPVQGGFLSVTVQGFLRAFTPQQISGGVQQGDAKLEILQDEIAAASWPGPPVNKDSVFIDGRTWTVQDASALFDGPVPLGFTLWIRGGR